MFWNECVNNCRDKEWSVLKEGEGHVSDTKTPVTAISPKSNNILIDSQYILTELVMTLMLNDHVLELTVSSIHIVIHSKIIFEHLLCAKQCFR